MTESTSTHLNHAAVPPAPPPSFLSLKLKERETAAFLGCAARVTFRSSFMPCLSFSLVQTFGRLSVSPDRKHGVLYSLGKYAQSQQPAAPCNDSPRSPFLSVRNKKSLTRQRDRGRLVKARAVSSLARGVGFFWMHAFAGQHKVRATESRPSAVATREKSRASGLEENNKNLFCPAEGRVSSLPSPVHAARHSWLYESVVNATRTLTECFPGQVSLVLPFSQNVGGQNHHQDGHVLLLGVPYLPWSRTALCGEGRQGPHLHPPQGGQPLPTEDQAREAPLDSRVAPHEQEGWKGRSQQAPQQKGYQDCSEGYCRSVSGGHQTHPRSEA
ncbi:ribosomal protein RPL24 [Toxoplasma gondii CAST]|uniref:Ribosomal protein RPL24 n=1 Tax=Toxoplasma gondii CAST TaxID=943122 RepID=A0A425HSX4_TOXGO|nr:ribosomal protein RPL24 [Toxoplasma gondii CAST]